MCSVHGFVCRHVFLCVFCIQLTKCARVTRHFAPAHIGFPCWVFVLESNWLGDTTPKVLRAVVAATLFTARSFVLLAVSHKVMLAGCGVVWSSVAVHGSDGFMGFPTQELIPTSFQRVSGSSISAALSHLVIRGVSWPEWCVFREEWSPRRLYGEYFVPCLLLWKHNPFLCHTQSRHSVGRDGGGDQAGLKRVVTHCMAVLSRGMCMCHMPGAACALRVVFYHMAAPPAEGNYICAHVFANSFACKKWKSSACVCWCNSLRSPSAHVSQGRSSCYVVTVPLVV